MVLKLDISKTFDKVEWLFTEKIMRRLGFAERWCHWIMKCITSVSYSILINATPSETIFPSGIRQRDLISPYIYLLCTDGLSHLIFQTALSGQQTGFQIRHGAPLITHMLFADDSLIFCKVTIL